MTAGRARVWGAAAMALAACMLAACAASRPLPVIGEVPGFQLTSQTGQPFDRRELNGKVWVADFFFTSCPGPCPMMSARMKQVQQATLDLADFRMVSFTVDPARDTPPVLAEYARTFRAQPGRWFLLTGSQGSLNDLGWNAFKLNAVDGSLNHATHFVLVDRKGRIRGYYAFTDDNFLSRLLGDVRRVEREKT